MNSETVLFEAQDTRVTSERLIIGKRTFAVRAISSASVIESRPAFSGVLSGVLIGGGLIAFGLDSSFLALSVVGVLVAGASIYAFQLLKPKFALMLRTSRGEIKAYESKSKPQVSEIVAALNQAMRQAYLGSES